MPARDLRVQIAGDATLLMRAVAEADGSLGKLNASVKRAATEQEAAWAKMSRGPKLAASAAMANAEAQEMASRRVKGSLTEMVAAHAAGLKTMGDNTVAAGHKVSSFGSSLLSFTVPLIGLGAVATKFAVDFNRNMEMLHTQAGYTQKQVDSLTKGVEKLSPKVGASPAELAEGLYHVASAGLKAGQALEVVEQAAIGAKMGNASLDETTYALTSLLKSAPKDIHNAADAMGLMNAVVGQGDMRMQDLVGSLSTGVVPAAQAAGLGFRDVGAAMDVMTARGIPAELSGTRLRMTFALMEKQSKKAAEALQEIGITDNQLGEDMRKPNGLLVAVEDLKHHLEASGKSATEQNRILLQVFGGGRSSAAIQTLIQNVGDLRKQYDKLPASAEAVKRLNSGWAAFNKTPAQQLAKDLQEANVALIGLGQDVLPTALPLMKEGAHIIGGLAHGFEGLPKPVKEAALYATLAAAGFGLLMKPVGGLIVAVGTFEKMLAGVGGSLGKFGAETEATLTAQAAVAEREGAIAGAAYGNAFTLAAGESMTASGLILPAGVKGIAGAGSLVSEAEAGAGVLGAGGLLKAAPGFLLKGALKGGAIAIGGGLAAQVAGSAIGGSAGHNVSSVGSDIAMGAGIGSFLGPEGMLAGGVLGGLIGGFQAFDKHAETEGRKIATHAAKGMGAPVEKALESGLEKAQKDAEKKLPQSELYPGTHVRPQSVGGRPRKEYEQALQDGQRIVGEQLGGEIVSQQLNVTHGLTGFEQITSIVTNAKKRLAELPPAARAGARNTIIEMVAELEHEKKLPVGSVAALVHELGRAFAGLEPQARKAASDVIHATAQELKGEKALQSAVGFVNQLRNVFPGIPKAANINASEATKFFQTNMSILDRLMFTGPEYQRKAAAQAYKRLKDEAVKYFADMHKGAEEQIKALNKKVGPLSNEGTAHIVRAYVHMRQAVEGQMALSVESVSKGLAQINKITAEEMKSLGLDNMAKNLHPAFGPSPGNSTLLQTSTIEGVGSSEIFSLAPGKETPNFGGKATGGMIGVPGERGYDTVPVLLGRGEAVLNHHQQPAVEIGLAYSKALGIQPYGSLSELFSRVQAPHYMASGGVVAPKTNVDGVFGEIVQRILDQDASAINRMIGQRGAEMGGGAPGPAGGPSGLGTFDGLQVAAWIIPELAYARAHGWTGHITSGYRPGRDPHTASGRSEHQGTRYPHGAVDFGGMIDPAGLANKLAFEHATVGYTGRRLLAAQGFRDDGHMSGTGHTLGGFANLAGGGFAGGQFVATAYGPPWGGIEGGGTTATGIDLSEAPHKYIIAVDPSVVPLGTEVKIWPNPFGYTGNFLAADTGGAIKGNRIDFYDWQGRAAQNAWGIRKVILSSGKSVTASAKKAEPGLTLSHGQEAHIGHLATVAEGLHGTVVHFSNRAAQTSGQLEPYWARWEAEGDFELGKGDGKNAILDTKQKTVTDKETLKYYRQELHALQKEAKAWAKLRDYFRHLARKLHGKAKRQALDTAGKYQKKIETAQRDAKALDGTIYAQETQVIKDESAEKALPGEITAAKDEVHYGAYQKDQERTTLEEEAGIITPQQAQARHEAIAKKALEGGYGELSGDDRLRVLADQRKATEANTKAQEENTKALTELIKTQNEQLQAAKQIAEIEAGVAIKALADVLNGQIGGVNYHGRAMTAGAPGVAARY